MSDYSSMTILELEAEKAKLESQKEVIRAEQRKICEVIEQKLAEARVLSLNEKERKSLSVALGKA